MRWRREDARYAAATLAALAFVGYLVIGNFGLVPSPLPGVTGAEAAPLEVPDFSGAAAEVTVAQGAQEGAAAAVLPQLLVPFRPGGGSSAPAPPPPADTAAPGVEITTPDGATITAAPGEEARIQGTASDADSGVARVEVTFSSGSNTQRVEATLDCSGPTQGFCAWSAPVPGIAATYEVQAHATDAAGNAASSRAITVTVVTTQNVTGDGSGDDGLLDTVGGAVGGLVDTVGGLLGL